MRKPVALLASLLTLAGCGIPAHDLNELEKTADIEWVFGVFEHNYAPATWKEKQFGLSLAQAKKDCLEQSKTIVKSDAFVALLNRCVNRFSDAHTHTMSGGASLPELAKVAYLGFTTETERIDLLNPPSARKTFTAPDSPAPTPRPMQVQTVLHVTKFLPTTVDGDFPVKVDDYIVEIDGKSVADYLTTEILPFGNLGQSNSSLTQAGPIFPLRSSFTHPLPAGDAVQLRLFRGGKFLSVALPWTVKDLVQFQQEQQEAQKAKKNPAGEAGGGAGHDHAKDKTKDQANRRANDDVLRPVYWEGNELFSTLLTLMNDYRLNPASRVQILLTQTFAKRAFNPVLRFLQDLFAAEADKKGDEQLPVEKTLTTVSSLKIENELFVARVFLQDDGSRVGYVRIDTFSIDDDKAAKTLGAIHQKFAKMKVKGVIYDTLNNGGGSLVAGLRLANLLTTTPLQYPSLQLALNDNWMNAFHTASLYRIGGGTSGSDSRRTLAARIFRQLGDDRKAGLRISRPISATELDPFILNEDKSLCQGDNRCLGADVKRVLLVNEMCASMCDIFASIFRDNKFGTIIGAQTMGAGGNVTLHGTSPISQIMMTQTESLILDVNGKYLENQGIVPDVAIDTLFDRVNGYAATYRKALAAVNQ